MIAATLFSGIGAPEMAMPHWQWAWHAEIEKFPAAVMAERHPDSVNLGDVSKALGNSMAVPVMRWILSRIERLSESGRCLPCRKTDVLGVISGTVP